MKEIAFDLWTRCALISTHLCQSLHVHANHCKSCDHVRSRKLIFALFYKKLLMHAVRRIERKLTKLVRGTEGYVDSACMGFLIHLSRKRKPCLRNLPLTICLAQVL